MGFVSVSSELVGVSVSSSRREAKADDVSPAASTVAPARVGMRTTATAVSVSEEGWLRRGRWTTWIGFAVAAHTTSVFLQLLGAAFSGWVNEVFPWPVLVASSLLVSSALVVLAAAAVTQAWRLRAFERRHAAERERPRDHQVFGDGMTLRIVAAEDAQQPAVTWWVDGLADSRTGGGAASRVGSEAASNVKRVERAASQPFLGLCERGRLWLINSGCVRVQAHQLGGAWSVGDTVRVALRQSVGDAAGCHARCESIAGRAGEPCGHRSPACVHFGRALRRVTLPVWAVWGATAGYRGVVVREVADRDGVLVLTWPHEQIRDDVQPALPRWPWRQLAVWVLHGLMVQFLVMLVWLPLREAVGANGILFLLFLIGSLAIWAAAQIYGAVVTFVQWRNLQSGFWGPALHGAVVGAVALLLHTQGAPLFGWAQW